MDLKNCSKCNRFRFSIRNCDCSSEKEINPKYSEYDAEKIWKIKNNSDFNEFSEPINNNNQNLIQKSAPKDQQVNVNCKHVSSKDIQTIRPVTSSEELPPPYILDFILSFEKQSVGGSSISAIHPEMQLRNIDTLKTEDQRGMQSTSTSAPNDQKESVSVKGVVSSQNIQTQRSVTCSEELPPLEIYPEIQVSRDIDTLKVENQRGIKSTSKNISNAEACSGHPPEGENHLATSIDASCSVAGPSRGPCELSRMENNICLLCGWKCNSKEALQVHNHIYHLNVVLDCYLTRVLSD